MSDVVELEVPLRAAGVPHPFVLGRESLEKYVLDSLVVHRLTLFWRSRHSSRTNEPLVLDEYRDFLEEMGQMVHDGRYENIILQALPAEYERVRNAGYENRDFVLELSLIHI